MPTPRHTPALILAVLVVAAVCAPRRAAALSCSGDCDGDGFVSREDLAVAVGIGLGGVAPETCANLDADADARILVNDIVAAVAHSLGDCGNPSPTPTRTPAATTATFDSTPTATPTRADGLVSIPEAVARDADGVAVHLGETLTTEGVLTVSAGIYANNKLKVVAQEDGAGIMILHQSSADVDAFKAGDRLRVSGLVRQLDPTSPDNPAIGTVLIDITQGSVALVSTGNPQAAPQTTTLASLGSAGVAYAGTLVRVDDVHRSSGHWPAVGDRSTLVEIDDGGGESATTVRFQRNTITPALVQKLNAIGDGVFSLLGVVVQDDATDDGKLLSGFQIWPRGSDDILVE